MKDFFLIVEGPINRDAPQGPITNGTSFHCTPNDEPHEYTGDWETEKGTNAFGVGIGDSGWYEWKTGPHQIDLTRPDPNQKQFSLMRFFGVKDPIETNLQRMDRGIYWVPALPVKKPKKPVDYSILWSLSLKTPEPPAPPPPDQDDENKKVAWAKCIDIKNNPDRPKDQELALAAAKDAAGRIKNQEMKKMVEGWIQDAEQSMRSKKK
jgi:hypothetical protein